jgi:hypothetical protein
MTSGDDASMADLMKQYTESMQSQFGNMMHKLKESMENHIGMSQMLNAMLENMLLQSLAVTTIVHNTPNGHLSLSLTLKNTATIVIPVVSCSISLQPRRQSSDKSPYNTVYHSRSPSDLAAGACFSHTIDLSLPSFDQYNGIVTVQCLSPGTSQALQTSYDFSVYFLHQAKIDVGPPNNKSDFSPHHTKALSLVRLREALRLSPLDGMLTEGHGTYKLCDPCQGFPYFALAVSPDSSGIRAQVAVWKLFPKAQWSIDDIVMELENLCGE